MKNAQEITGTDAQMNLAADLMIEFLNYHEIQIGNYEVRGINRLNDDQKAEYERLKAFRAGFTVDNVTDAQRIIDNFNKFNAGGMEPAEFAELWK